MHDLLQGLSQQWGAISTNYYVHQLIDAVQQLWEGIRDRLTPANAFKVVLLVVVLYLTLRIVGSKNGIKGSQEWPKLKVQVDDRLSDQEVRLPRGNFVPRIDAKKYDDRSGTVVFREVAPPTALVYEVVEQGMQIRTRTEADLAPRLHFRGAVDWSAQ
jgi:hypothetical protein